MYLASAAPDYEHIGVWMYYQTKVSDILNTDYKDEIRTHPEAQKLQAKAKGMTHEQWIDQQVEKIRNEKINELRQALGYDVLEDSEKTEKERILETSKSIRDHYDDLRKKLEEYKLEVRDKESKGISVDSEADSVVNQETGKIDIRALDREISREQLKNRKVKDDGGKE